MVRRVLGMEIRRQFVDDSGHVGDTCLFEPSSGLEIFLVDHAANPGDGFSEFRTGLDHLEFVVAKRSDLDEWANQLDTLQVPHSGVKEPRTRRTP